MHGSLRVAIIAAALVLMLVPGAPPPASGQTDPEDILHGRIPTQDSQGELAGTPESGVALNMEIVGRHGINGRGFNADVWVHRGIAYVGQWGFGDPQHPERCPSGDRAGVKVFNVADPRNPVLISTLRNPPQTTAEDVQVLTYASGRFRGRDIAIVGIQACFRSDPGIRRGLQLFDVTDPARPKELGFLDAGVPNGGVHEFWAVQRRDGVFAILAVPFSMFRDPAGRGDVRIADVSDPTRPVEIADWSSERELGPAFGTFGGFGCFPFIFAHGAMSNRGGTLAIVSHWDLGNVFLDISDPRRPVFLGRTGYPPNSEGDAHSSELTEDGQYLVTADEVIPPNSNCQAPDKKQEDTWGFMRVFRITDLSNPVQVGQYKTPNSSGPSRIRKGDYSIHNPVVRGHKAYLSWYSDGVRVLDISSPEQPMETAYLVPPPVKDPLHVLGFVPEVWGVVVDDRGCIYLSEMNFGLYIVRENGTTTCGGPG